MKTAQNIAHIILVGNSTEEHTISYRYRENNVCRQSGDAILFPWMGIDHLLLFPGLFQKYIETVCRKSEVSCEDL